MQEGKTRYLTKTSQYVMVHKSGSLWSGNLLVIKALPNGFSYNRFGFIVGKKVGKAVARNRVKRLLREIMRQTKAKPGWDIVFIARPDAEKAGFTELKSQTCKLLFKAGLIVENYEKTRLSPD
ncbi:MAG TPA: ribonuclease P protein component [Dehalococcoidia bacterium]|nr:ribonuclease P protein component [Dehalococcoidia bacterium]